jgi:hypothetical protein
MSENEQELSQEPETEQAIEQDQETGTDTGPVAE